MNGIEPAGMLHIDDNEDDRFLFKRAWQHAGIHLSLVSLASGEACIDYLAGNGEYADRSMYPLPCILFLDLKMNGTSGFDVLEWVRKQPFLQHLVIILYSSSNHSSDVQRGMELGANAFVTKPVGNQRWVELLESVKNFWLRFHEFPWPSKCQAPETVA
jgi:CheY-like chemotaxis protein